MMRRLRKVGNFITTLISLFIALCPLIVAILVINYLDTFI